MIVGIIRTILRYPVGAVVGFNDNVATEYRIVSGYYYTCGAFYVLFSEGNMVNMERLQDLVVSIRKKEGKVCR